MRHARTRLLPVDEHGARATLRFTTTVFRTREIEIVAQYAEQRRLRVDVNGNLLSVDIDFNDYWVWKAMQVARPRVVSIEYNASLRPPLSLVVPYNPDSIWTGGNYFGASLEALVRLGTLKGYRLVGCCFAGVNAFFVRDDLCEDLFFEPATAEEHYEPARYFASVFPAGHSGRPGPYIKV